MPNFKVGDKTRGELVRMRQKLDTARGPGIVNTPSSLTIGSTGGEDGADARRNEVLFAVVDQPYAQQDSGAIIAGYWTGFLLTGAMPLNGAGDVEEADFGERGPKVTIVNSAELDDGEALKTGAVVAVVLKGTRKSNTPPLTAVVIGGGGGGGITFVALSRDNGNDTTAFNGFPTYTYTLRNSSGVLAVGKSPLFRQNGAHAAANFGLAVQQGGQWVLIVAFELRRLVLNCAEIVDDDTGSDGGGGMEGEDTNIGPET